MFGGNGDGRTITDATDDRFVFHFPDSGEKRKMARFRFRIGGLENEEVAQRIGCPFDFLRCCER
jgi:hypothetical protein